MDPTPSSRSGPNGAALSCHDSQTEYVDSDALCLQINVLINDVPIDENLKNHLESVIHSAGPQNERVLRNGKLKLSPRPQRSHSQPKSFWSKEEDEKLIELVQKQILSSPKDSKIRSWTRVASELGKRTRKQCRERYLHHLKPGISRHQWSSREDKILIGAHKRCGNKWVTIAAELPGRTENCVKNRWNSILRRKQRRISDPKAIVRDGASTIKHRSDVPPNVVPLATPQQFSTPSSIEARTRESNVTFSTLMGLLKSSGLPPDVMAQLQSVGATSPSAYVPVITVQHSLAQISPFVSPGIRFTVKVLRAMLRMKPSNLLSQIGTAAEKGSFEPDPNEKNIESLPNEYPLSDSKNLQGYCIASRSNQKLKRCDVIDFSTIDSVTGENNKNTKHSDDLGSTCKVAVLEKNISSCNLKSTDAQIEKKVSSPSMCHNDYCREHSKKPLKKQNLADTMHDTDGGIEMAVSRGSNGNISNPLKLLALAANTVSRSE